jgi:hypothetical protein
VYSFFATVFQVVGAWVRAAIATVAFHVSPGSGAIRRQELQVAIEIFFIEANFRRHFS